LDPEITLNHHGPQVIRQLNALKKDSQPYLLTLLHFAKALDFYAAVTVVIE